MTERLLVDYSFGRPDPRALKACGYEGVVRYLAFDNAATAGKLLRPLEVAALHAAGLTIRLNWENGGDDVLGGFMAGDRAGAEVARQCGALGAPPGLPVYYSVDFDAQPAQYDVIEAYLRAAHVTSGRPVGVYGSADLVEAMVGRGAATLAWQTEAWSGGRVSPITHLYQRVGRGTLPGAGQFGDSIDEDVICRDDHAAWLPPGAHPTPDHHLEDDDMQILAEATKDSAGVTRKVRKGNVFLLPSGVYVAGKTAEAHYVAAGVAKAGRQKLTGDEIRAFL